MPDPVLEDFLGGSPPGRTGIARIVLFGSRTRGDFQPESDYELLREGCLAKIRNLRGGQ